MKTYRTVTPRDIKTDTDIDLGGGYTARVTIEHDEFSDAPWDQCDGHGLVSDWERRVKRPGEMVLCADGARLSGRAHCLRRFYDFAAAVRIARADAWDAEPYGQGTKGERAHRAAMADFEYLRAWCNDGWHYVVVCTVVRFRGDNVADDCIGGVEDWKNCHLEFAADQINSAVRMHQDARQRAIAVAREARADLHRERHEAREWAARGVLTVGVRA